MAKHLDTICLTGECSDIQNDVSLLINEGYKVLDIHSQFIVNEKGYDKPKSIVWLQKECEVSYE